LNTSEQGRRDEATDRDPGSGGDPDGVGGGVSASSGKGLPPCGGRAFTLDASLVFHRWLVDDKRGKTLKQVKEKDVR
jgi:hypothetical protein